MSNNGTNLALNSLRTLAALAVVVSHVRALFFVDFGGSTDQSLLAQLFYLGTSWGHQAVIIFFVLSGYWVGGSVIRNISRSTFSWRTYGVARLSRLWLVLVPAIALTQLADRLGNHLFPGSSIYAGSAAFHGVIPSDGPTAHLGALETLGNIFFLQSIRVETLGSNSPLWSLAYEFWYYLLFPALLVAIVPSTTRRRVVALALFVVGVLIAGPAVLASFPFWLLGAGVAWQRTNLLNLTSRLTPALFTAGRVVAAFVLVACLCLVSFVELNEIASGLVIAVPATILIVLLLGDVTSGPAVQTLRPFSWAADWSYSLYAVHVPVLAFAFAAIVGGDLERLELSASSMAIFVAITTGVCAIGFLFSLVTERRTDAVRALLSPSRASFLNKN